MDLESWRKSREGEPYTLPSGLDVRLRRVQLLDLAEQGRIPAPLLAMADALLTQESVTLTVESFQANAGVITLIAGACLAAPEGLQVEELPVADRLAIYNWANEVLVAVRPFRGQPDRGAEPGGAGARLRQAAVGDPGNR